MRIKPSLKSVFIALIVLAGTALCMVLAVLALREVSFIRFGQAMLTAALATLLVRWVQGASAADDDLPNNTQR